MKCIHDLQAEIDATLDTAFEAYGRAVFFNDSQETHVVSNTINLLLSTADDLAEGYTGPVSTEDNEELGDESPEVLCPRCRIDLLDSAKH